MNHKHDIVLGPEEIRLLKDAEQHTGKPWRTLLRELLAAITATPKPSEHYWIRAQEESLEKIWDNEEDSVFDDL